MDASELLAVWEQGFRVSPPERPLHLLAAADAERTQEELADLPVGRRDRELFLLRRWLFGGDLQGTTACPSCGERLEMSIDSADLLVDEPTEGPTPLVVEGCLVEFRVPSTADLIAISVSPQTGDADTARARVLERCVLAARDATGKTVSISSLPATVVETVIARMAEADPQADVTLHVVCPACACSWEAPFDIAAFLWDELDLWARRVLREVAMLARVNGWSEREVLALSPTRRRLYVDLASV